MHRRAGQPSNFTGVTLLPLLTPGIRLLPAAGLGLLLVLLLLRRTSNLAREVFLSRCELSRRSAELDRQVGHLFVLGLRPLLEVLRVALVSPSHAYAGSWRDLLDLLGRVGAVLAGGCPCLPAVRLVIGLLLLDRHDLVAVLLLRQRVPSMAVECPSPVVYGPRRSSRKHRKRVRQSGPADGVLADHVFAVPNFPRLLTITLVSFRRRGAPPYDSEGRGGRPGSRPARGARPSRCPRSSVLATSLPSAARNWPGRPRSAPAWSCLNDWRGNASTTCRHRTRPTERGGRSVTCLGGSGPGEPSHPIAAGPPYPSGVDERWQGCASALANTQAGKATSSPRGAQPTSRTCGSGSLPDAPACSSSTAQTSNRPRSGNPNPRVANPARPNTEGQVPDSHP